MSSVLPWFAVLALGCSLAGCAAPQHTADQLAGHAPPDFAVEVEVLNGDMPRRAGGVLVGGGVGSPTLVEDDLLRQPSKYVLFADGSLCYGRVRADRRSDWFPELRRVLSRPQVAQVWDLVNDLGLADREQADEPASFELAAVEPGQVRYLVAITAFERRWMFDRTLAGDEAPPALAGLIEHLGELAWAEQFPDVPVRAIPKRYDFGPDPYARYRGGE